MGLVQKELAGSALDCNVHIISWSRYQGSPDTIPFLLNIYDRQSYVIKVDNIETEEFYPFVTADLSCNSSKSEAFTQGEAFTHFLPAERHRYVRIPEVKKCSFLGKFYEHTQRMIPRSSWVIFFSVDSSRGIFMKQLT